MHTDWERWREEMRLLYMQQDEPLHEVRRLMKGRHGVDACDRAYRNKFAKWGFKKNRIGKKNGQKPQSAGSVGGSLEFSNCASTSASGDVNRLINFSIHPDRTPDSTSPINITNTWPIGTIPASTSAVPNEPQPSNDPSHNPAQPIPLPKGYILPSSRKGLTVNLQDVVGRTRLHRAVIDGSEDEIKELLPAGAAVNSRDHVGNGPLHYAAAGGSEAIVQLLLDFGAEIDARGNSGRTPLHMSLQAPKIFETLLKARPLISIQDDRGDTPLHLALSTYTSNSIPSENSAAIRLLDHRADVNIRNAAGTTPFHLVLDQSPQADWSYSSTWMMRFLGNGADIFLRTRDGQLPFSVYLNHLDSNWTRRSSSVQNRPEIDNTVLKRFLTNGADPNTRLNSGETLLHHSLQRGIAADTGDWHLGMLLCQKADISNAGLTGDYPLHAIVKQTTNNWNYSHVPDLIRILVSRLADPNQLNRDGLTPLTMLLSHKDCRQVETTRALLKAGADPLQQSLTAEFPIYLAMRCCNDTVRPELAEALLAAALEYNPAKRAACQPGELPRDVQWWHDWVAISTALDWATTKKKYVSSESVLDKDIREAVSKIAMKLTAQRCLDVAATDYEDLKKQTGASRAQAQTKQSQIVTILRDCRDLGIEVEVTWFKYLLNFFD